MDRDHAFRVEIFHRLNIFARQEVDISPIAVVLTVFQDCEIKKSVLQANFFKVIVIATVATDVNSLGRRL